MTTRFQITLYRHGRDTAPQSVALPLKDLAHAVAPEHAEIRGDLFYPCDADLQAIAQALAAFQRGARPTPALQRWFDPIAAAAKAAASEGGDRDAQSQAARVEAERLQRERRQAAKGRLPAWSPARLREGGHRCKADVVDLSCLVLDFDDGTSIDEAIEPWSRNTVLVATSWSHTEAQPKFRLVMPLAVPVPAELWSVAWTWAFARSKGRADKVCSDTSRMYYLPARPHAWAPYEACHIQLEGPLLAMDIEGLRRETLARQRAAHAPLRPVTLPPAEAWLLAGQRLRHSPDARIRAGEALGGELAGDAGAQRVDHVPCPRCGRPAVWWWVAPDRKSNASCKHDTSCGWSAPLVDLLGGARHV